MSWASSMNTLPMSVVATSITGYKMKSLLSEPSNTSFAPLTLFSRLAVYWIHLPIDHSMLDDDREVMRIFPARGRERLSPTSSYRNASRDVLINFLALGMVLWTSSCSSHTC